MNHAGGWAGFGTFIQRDLQNNVTLVFLSNRGGFKSDKIINPVWELYAEKKKE
jgi:CubicO group peptidase (beta-lactamase class C family)